MNLDGLCGDYLDVERVRRDALLVVQAQLGDRRSLAELVGRWHDPIWRYVRRMLGAPGLADDVSQEVWAAALIIVGLTWGVFAAWVLARRPLFAIDRLIAAALAVLFSALTTVGVAAVAIARGSMGGFIAAIGVGLICIVLSVTKLARARAYRAVLLARARELNQPSTEQS